MKIKKVVTGLVLCAMMAASIAMPSRAASNSTSKLYNGSLVNLYWHLSNTRADASAEVNLAGIMPSIQVFVYNEFDSEIDRGSGVYDVVVIPTYTPSWARYKFKLNGVLFHDTELHL